MFLGTVTGQAVTRYSLRATTLTRRHVSVYKNLKYYREPQASKSTWGSGKPHKKETTTKLQIPRTQV